MHDQDRETGRVSPLGVLDDATLHTNVSQNHAANLEQQGTPTYLLTSREGRTASPATAFAPRARQIRVTGTGSAG